MTPFPQSEQFDPLLKGLIPPIVKTKMGRSDALNYASGPLEGMRPKEAERFQEVFLAELNGLNESNCARYAVAPEMIAGWKRRFEK
jgi:hypothetical protein